MSRRDAWPEWVKLGLMGLPNRASALAFAALCVLLAVGSVIYAFMRSDARFFAGLLLVLAAAWYVAAARWVDENGGWD